MRIALLLTVLGSLALPAPAEEAVNEEVVEALRAVLDAKREAERDELLARFLQRSDLDWASVRKALREGRYYRKPLVTAYGERHSSKHFDLVLSGPDGRPRGFSLFLPKAYEAKEPLPVLVYLHHGPGAPHLRVGKERAGVALFRFRKMCEKHGILFVAPYTSKGAEWWTPEGRRLVAWTLKQVRRLYKIDDDRIGLMGALGGADAVWCLGQEMPGVWSVLMPMTGDAYEIGAMIRPLFLGTLDRMDILVGVPGKTKSTVGEKDANQFLAGLRPMFGQRMRITAAIYPTSQSDFHYLPQITEQVASFLLAKKRKPFADEVDVETEKDQPLQALWLRNDGGYDPDGDVPPARISDFKSTLLRWEAPRAKEADKKLGVNLQARPHWEIGVVITNTPGEAQHAKIYHGDVLLEADGVPIRKAADLKQVIQKHQWGEEVRLLLAREVAHDQVARERKKEERYRKLRRKIEELRREGKPIPEDLGAELEDDEEGEEEIQEEEDDDGIIISDDDEPATDDEAPGRRGERKQTEILILERWVMLREPAGALVRPDFGASWDRKFEKEGVRIASVYAGSLADRVGFKPGDVIIQIGDTEVKKIHDVARYLKEIDFKFEKAAEGQRGIDFTIKRQQGQEGHWQEKTLHAKWEPVLSSRVDAKWNKKENTLNVLARKAAGFTLFFADELIEPGKDFHLYVNGIPYQDLVDPAKTPEYPHPRPGSDPALGDELYRMRRKRAKVKGWEPDIKWAIEEYLGHWDRRLVLGAQRSFDLTTMKEGFRKARHRGMGRRGKKGARIKEAYDKHRERAQG
ncbi:MAG: PDZ domain-containing protein [Planctomycetota bacterium]|jgi:hypothetical protein